MRIKNITKNKIAEVEEVLTNIDLDNKYDWVIINSNINATKNLKLIDIKKY